MASRGILASKVSPAYLHGNSTSHTWAFSAIAELIDNAYDPDVNASELWIDKRVINETVCLTFVDNGNGMTPGKQHKMLSFGFCEKVAVGNHKPIGHYGNGFKSGSMRLGKDAIVFTRQANVMSVGLLSQTYLQNIKAETVLVPIVSWNLPSKQRSHTVEANSSLRTITTHSIFKSEHELLKELDAMEKLRTGTKIIIYNLTKSNNGNLELDFMSDPQDIRNPETHLMDYSTINRAVKETAPEYKLSLREYCSILYRKPKMKIVLRGKKVQTKLIMKSLSQTETDVYKPTWLQKPIPIKFGFTASKNSEDYGILMYHKNRLIRAFEKVGYQKQPNELGIGVVGVVEAFFLQPTHNKQDFNRDDKYNAFIANVSQKLNDYWNEKRGGNNVTVVRQNVQPRAPDWTWVQCDNCLKWRRLPTGYTSRNLPEKWYCHQNPDAAFNRCDIDEEPEDEDEALLGPTYKKTFKKQQQEEKLREKLFKTQQDKAKEIALQAKENFLRRKEMEMKRKQTTGEVSGSSSPTQNRIDEMAKSIQQLNQRAIKQQKLIEDLKKQKLQQEKCNKAMLEAAENLNLVNLKNTELLEKAASVGNSSSAVKRKKESDEICVKTEDGGVVAIIKDNNVINVVDLTINSDNEDENPPSPKRAKKGQSNPASPKDVKPTPKELAERMAAYETHVDQGVQTDPVKLHDAEDKEALQQCKTRLISLQRNVHKLLKMIVPDEDLGTAENIDEIVREMIKHSEPSSTTQ